MDKVMYQQRKAYFTLLELLIVMVIIAAISAGTGIQIGKMYSEQRFLFEVQQVANHLQTAQDLMLMLDCDTTLTFGRDPKTHALGYQFNASTPLPQGWGALVDKQYALKSISQIEFEGLRADQGEGIPISFFSRGMCMSQGKLILSRGERSHKQSYQICLYGYPHVIASQPYQETVDKLKDDSLSISQTLYPKELMKENG